MAAPAMALAFAGRPPRREPRVWGAPARDLLLISAPGYFRTLLLGRREPRAIHSQVVFLCLTCADNKSEIAHDDAFSS